MADFVAGDSGTTLIVTCIGTDGEILNLTGAEVKILYRIGSTLYTAKVMTVLTPETEGQAQYKFAGADLGNEGIMYAEIEIRFSGQLISSADVLLFTVRGKTIV